MKFVSGWIKCFVMVAWGGLVGWSAVMADGVDEYYWPTPNTAFVKGKGIEDFVQPTVSGLPHSALFGCVRNGGKRFHEGLDLKPVYRDAKNEPTDDVYAFCDGVVRYVNRDAALSSYGRYIVVEHPQIASGVVSLYAHLRAIPEEIDSGRIVEGGDVIATMGRSANHVIPRSRAHLHFELGLWFGRGFQLWYDARKFDSENDHGDYNGMNIVGIDVWRFWKAYREGEVNSLWDFIESEPIAVTVDVPRSLRPELVKAIPQLVVGGGAVEDAAGWRIGFTWYGAPVRWEVLAAGDIGSASVKIVAVDSALLGQLGCDNMVGPGGAIGSRLWSVLARLFIKSGSL